MAFPSISELTLRLESALGVTKDGSDRVSSWVDQANSYNFTQTDDDCKFIHTANVFGISSTVVPGMYLDGTNDFMQNSTAWSNLISETACEIFVVKRTLAQAATLKAIFGTNDATVANNSYVGDSSTVGSSVFTLKPSGSAISTTVPGQINTKAYIIHSYHDNGYLYQTDGYARSRNSGIGIADTGNTSATSLAYGSYIGRLGTDYWNGYIGAIIVFSRTLTKKERIQMYTYLAETYSIQYPALFTGNGGSDSTGDGLSMSTRWGTVKGALAKSTLNGAYGVRLIVKNTTNENITGSHCSLMYSGTSKDNMCLMNWARPYALFTADFVNGSKVVTNVTGITVTNTQHAARAIQAGSTINQVEKRISDTSFYLLNNYAGPTASNVSCSLYFDDDYGYCQSLNFFDGSNESWNTDPQSCFQLYNSTGNYYPIYGNNKQFWNIKRLYVTDNLAGTSVYSASFTGMTTLKNCIFARSVNGIVISWSSICGTMQCCTILGSNNASHTTGIGLATITSGGASILLIDVGFSQNAVASYTALLNGAKFVNCNFEVNGLVSSSSIGIYLNSSTSDGIYTWLDKCEFHPSMTKFQVLSTSVLGQKFIIYSQSHNRILGNNLVNIPQIGTIQGIDSTVDTTIPSDAKYVLDCIFDQQDYSKHGKRIDESLPSDAYALKIFEQIYYCPVVSGDVEVRVSSSIYLTNEEIWAEVEFINSITSETAWSSTLSKSTNNIEVRSGISDYSQKLVANIPFTAVKPDGYSLVKVSVFGAWYDPSSSNHVYVCPNISLFNMQPVLNFGNSGILGVLESARFTDPGVNLVSRELSSYLFAGQTRVPTRLDAPESSVIEGSGSYGDPSNPYIPSFDLDIYELTRNDPKGITEDDIRKNKQVLILGNLLTGKLGPGQARGRLQND